MFQIPKHVKLPPIVIHPPAREGRCCVVPTALFPSQYDLCSSPPLPPSLEDSPTSSTHSLKISFGRGLVVVCCLHFRGLPLLSESSCVPPPSALLYQPLFDSPLTLQRPVIPKRTNSLRGFDKLKVTNSTINWQTNSNTHISSINWNFKNQARTTNSMRGVDDLKVANSTIN